MMTWGNGKRERGNR